MSDDLGQQQDDLARLRYELAKSLECADDFQQCNSAMDVYRRLLDLGQEGPLREELTRSLQRLSPGVNAEPWLDPLVQAIRVNDQASFDKINQSALIAAIFPSPNQ